uniref:C2 domain-containing protein n=1 Tax=Monopterus albus TaxID=43700 RepID=A0A3Q3QX19_MONAL
MGLFFLFVCSDQVLLLAAGLSVGLLLLLLLGLMMYCLWRKKKGQRRYQELLSTVPSVPVCSAPVIPVSLGSWAMSVPQNTFHIKLAVVVVAPPPGMATRLCFSVEYRHSSEQLIVSLLRLANLPPQFHGNVTLVQLQLLPDDRRPRQTKARGTGPDPEFSDCFVFQVSGVCVPHSTLSVCVLSVEQDGKRRAVGRVLFPLERELGQAGRVLWRDLEPEDNMQCSELGDVQICLSYSPSLQRLSVVVLRARGLQLLTDKGVCVQVSLQILTQVVKLKRSCVVKGEKNPYFNHRMTFKLRSQHLDEACLKFELQHHIFLPEPPVLLGVLVLGPFMYARGPQMQHWMDMVNTPQEPVKLWHGLGRAI